MDRHFRFLPTEEELVNHYLRKKKQDKDFKVDHIIPEIDICKHEPGIPEEHPQPEDLELIFPALQLQDYMLEMDTEVADV
ncbi:hypothetical protein CerSpe_086260 [Prunus speciosa]